MSNYRNGNDDLFVMNADVSNPTRLTITPKITGESPSWSPDARRITFGREGQVWVINADGTNPVSLGRGDWPDWSPDGTKIAFTDDWQDADEYGNVYTMSPNGSNRTFVSYGIAPDFSPDGKRLVIKDLFESNTGIFTVNTDGSGYLDTYPMDGWSHVERPTWSPDGTKVAFGVEDHLGVDGEVTGLAVSHPDGSDLTVADTAPATWDIDWGPKPHDATAPAVKAPTRSLVAASAIGDATVPVNVR